ncbi:MAG TPA: hypothetical protein VFW40_06585, partial [Capsulimonadaceae bacterium]|nr:hypothetical protein [Capsulimonadaceae bacterium]
MRKRPQTSKKTRSHPRSPTPDISMGYGRRSLLVNHAKQAETGRTLTAKLAQIERLEAQLAERERQLAEAQAIIKSTEHAHDERNAEAEALRRVGESLGALFDL